MGTGLERNLNVVGIWGIDDPTFALATFAPVTFATGFFSSQKCKVRAWVAIVSKVRFRVNFRVYYLVLISKFQS